MAALLFPGAVVVFRNVCQRIIRHQPHQRAALLFDVCQALGLPLELDVHSHNSRLQGRAVPLKGDDLIDFSTLAECILGCCDGVW